MNSLKDYVPTMNSCEIGAVTLSYVAMARAGSSVINLEDKESIYSAMKAPDGSFDVTSHEYVYGYDGSVFGAFIQTIHEAWQVIRRIEDELGFPLIGEGETKILVVSDKTFHEIQPGVQLPDWVGAFTWWDGRIVYNCDYIKRFFKEGGSVEINSESRERLQFTLEQFLFELIHEFWHAVDDSYIRNKLGTTNEFYYRRDFNRRNSWFVEGAIEFLARGSDTKIPPKELSQILSLRPKFGIPFDSGFWAYDNNPPAFNMVYRYCRGFVGFLLPKIRESSIIDELYLPYQKKTDTLALILFLRIIFENGFTNVFDALRHVGIEYSDVLELEKRYRSSILD